ARTAPRAIAVRAEPRVSDEWILKIGMPRVESGVEDRDRYASADVAVRVHDIRADQRNTHAKIAAAADIQIDSCDRRIRIQGFDRICSHITGKCGYMIPSRGQAK